MDTKELQNWWKDDYPKWKEVMWRAGRTFVATFIPTFIMLISTVEAKDLDDKEKRASLIVSIIVSSCSAGLVAAGKIIREKFVEEGWLQKLPV